MPPDVRLTDEELANVAHEQCQVLSETLQKLARRGLHVDIQKFDVSTHCHPGIMLMLTVRKDL